MKLPSMEEGIAIFIKALEVFAKEIEEFLETIINKLKEALGR